MSTPELKQKVKLTRAMPLLRRFWPYLRPERRSAAWIGVLAVLALPPAVISPLLVRHLFDQVLPRDDVERLLQLAAVMVGLALFSAALTYGRTLISIGLRNRIRFRLTRDLFVHTLRLPLRYFDRTETGYLMSRVRDDVAALDNVMIDQVAEAAVNLLKAVVFLGLLFALDVGLATSGVTLIVLVTGMVWAVSPLLRRRSETAREADARSSAALHQSLDGVATVRTTAQEWQENRRFLGATKESVRAAVRRDILSGLVGTLFSLVGTVGVYVIVAVAAYRISAGVSTFGNLLAFFLFLMQLMSSSGALFSLVPGIQRSLASLERLFDLLDEDPERRLAEGASEPTKRSDRLRGAVELRGVSFRYEDGPQVLDGIDLAVDPGETIALVGRSGAGKTTLVHLIPRLYLPTSGEVLFDGRPADQYPLGWLRRQIGVVPQDVFLFDRTIYENIAYGRPGATEEEVRSAAEAAHADVFVQRLAEGYQTLVGERGVRLSGGELDPPLSNEAIPK